MFDLIIVGVGGQGAILASDIIGKAAVAEGLPVTGAETHGMAQRGGAVENHVRIGCQYGSMIPAGGADCMLSMEPLEALRFAKYLKPDGFAVVNTERIVPVTVYSGPGNWHTGVVHRPLDTTRQASFRSDIHRLTQELATVFERDILEHPEQWHLYRPNWPSDQQGPSDRETP